MVNFKQEIAKESKEDRALQKMEEQCQRGQSQQQFSGRIFREEKEKAVLCHLSREKGRK